MKKPSSPIFAWLILGLISTILCWFVIWLVELFFVVPLPNVVLIIFIVLGFFPALCAIFGLRLLGIIGFFGIVVGILWGLIHATIYGSMWQYVFIFDFIRVYSVFIILGCLVQLFLGGLTGKKKKRPMKNEPLDTYRVYEI